MIFVLIFILIHEYITAVLSPTIFPVYINDIISQFPFSVHRFIVLYADDIIFMTPPVTELQRILSLDETEFNG